MPASYARVAFQASQSQSQALIVNVLHLEVDTLSSPVNWNNVATDVAGWLSTPWRAMLNSGANLHNIVVTDENYPGSSHGQGSASVELAGTRVPADSNLSPALCGVITFRTAVAKRYARGWMFAPPAIGSASLGSGGTWNFTNAYWTAMVAFWDAYRVGHTSGSTSYLPIVFSRHQVTTSQTPFIFPITGGGPVGTQRFLRSRLTSP